jgi:hypothetical protein
MPKCNWDTVTECRFPKNMAYLEEWKSQRADINPHCNLCIMAEISRQLRLLSARQS